MSAPLKIKIYYMSAQQNMGENLVFIPHQILIFYMEISEELCDFYWGSRNLTEENFGYCSSYSRQEIF